MSCPETASRIIQQLCGLHYYPGINTACKNHVRCNKHFARWLKTEPEVQKIHKSWLVNRGETEV